MSIKDKYGRTFQTLRVSLTNSCNLGCVYCVYGSEKENVVSSEKTLPYKELISIIKSIHEHTPLQTLRITGGEPTLYKDLVPFIQEVRAIGISELKMTTNGYLLYNLIPALANAGLKSINISLDALTDEGFKKMAGRTQLNRVLEAIDLALKYNIKIKLNAVILNGLNDDQIIPLLHFSKERNITIRFLELMQMGPLHQSEKFEQYFFSEQEILDKISTYYSFEALSRIESATTNYWKIKDGFQFGIIANESTPFCHDCNRLRLDSYGKIYGCLSNETGIPIYDALNQPEEMKGRLAKALALKQEVKFKGSNLSMMQIGG